MRRFPNLTLGLAFKLDHKSYLFLNYFSYIDSKSWKFLANFIMPIIEHMKLI